MVAKAMCPTQARATHRPAVGVWFENDQSQAQLKGTELVGDWAYRDGQQNHGDEGQDAAQEHKNHQPAQNGRKTASRSENAGRQEGTNSTQGPAR